MMCGHGANPIFFNKKKKRLDSQNTRHPYPPTTGLKPHHHPLKVDVICVSPLIVADLWLLESVYLLKQLHHVRIVNCETLKLSHF